MSTPDFDELLDASSRFSHACLLHSNNAPNRRYDWIAALGARRVLQLSAGDALDQLRRFAGYNADELKDELFSSARTWLFGFLGYDLKNETCIPEQRLGSLTSRHPDRMEFPDLCWFEPEYVWVCRNGTVTQCAGPEWTRSTDQDDKSVSAAPDDQNSSLTTDFTFPDYVTAVEAVREHIRQGDVYELNLCKSSSRQVPGFDPRTTFRHLNARTRAPFAAFLQVEGRYALSASPERFLELEGRRLRSQPIKGTAARGRTAEEDLMTARTLEESVKDRAENVMIVDLVRNDLARCCIPGSVVVPALMERHTFTTLHHLISTVEGELAPGLDFTDALSCCFPMGSMTGAPKISALELIERYERSRRGLFSGSIGYLDPEGNMDLNVVIRTLLYREDTATAVWSAGGAITWDSNPESEWKEIELKAQAIDAVLGTV